MTIDRALSGNPFSIDQFRCRDAAEVVRNFRPVHRVEPWSDLPRRSQFVFKSLFISICHQFNWDYLQMAMASWLLPYPELRLDDLLHTRPQDIDTLLADYPKRERVRASQRAKMLRETAATLIQLVRSGSIDMILENPALEGEQGFYNVIKTIPAYAEDALEKKARVLAHDLYREGVLAFRDPENLRPAIEYHILRLYIRTGRVYPIDSSVRQSLSGPSQPARDRLVRLLRERVQEAMNLTAFYSNIDVASLNYIEWQIGRSICIPDIPLCTFPPQGLAPDVAKLCIGSCGYVGFCRAFNDVTYGWFNEPQFQKAIY